MWWYKVTFLPLHPGATSCWVGALSWVGEAASPEEASQRAREESGHGPEVRCFVETGQVIP